MPVTAYANAVRLRSILKPSVVRLHHVPGWLKKRIRRRFDLWAWCYSPEHFLLNSYPSPAKWIDHFGSTILPDGSVAFVSEPYGDIERVRETVSVFAAEIGVDCFFTTNSYWYPGATIRIGLHEGPGSVPFDQLKRKPRKPEVL